MGGQTTLKLHCVRALSWELPGHGQKCDRGGWAYRTCPSQRHFVRYQLSCGGRTCPAHWRDWLRREAHRAAGRINRVRGDGQIVQHVVVSLPSGTSAPANTDIASAQRSLVYWILKFLGADGGSVVFHHKRITKHGRHPGSQNIHYHAVVGGRINPELVCGLYAQHGIIVRGLGRTRNVRVQLEYILSHASVPTVRGADKTSAPGTDVGADGHPPRPSNPANSEKYGCFLHVVHWFGAWSYNKRPLPKLEDRVFCPGCGRDFNKRDWMRIFFIGSDPPPTDKWGVLDWNLWRACDVGYVM